MKRIMPQQATQKAHHETKHKPTVKENWIAKTAMAASVGMAALVLSACNKPSDTSQTGAASSPVAAAPALSQAAQAPQAAQVAQAAPAAGYSPLTANQLYQLVAPIALFPDKLVALVLAGATYPDQISAANTWLGENRNLKGAQLVEAANQQNWDPSVKALTAFPAVLSQMASNLRWTSALGQAYDSDPTDVLNAIQAMRLRAKNAGNLQTSSRIRVSAYAYSLPANYSSGTTQVIPVPEQNIVIEPAEPDVVYVPYYNSEDVYGGHVPYYPGYDHRPPPPPNPGGIGLTTGLLSFGAGVAVGEIFAHRDAGWHAWGMNWGGAQHRPGNDRGHDSDRVPPRPAVVYNNRTFVSQSTTIVNHINNTHITENIGNTQNNDNRAQGSQTNIDGAHRGPGGAPESSPRSITAPTAVPGEHVPHVPHGPPGTALSAAPQTGQTGGSMSVPHFTPNDTRPGEHGQHAAATGEHNGQAQPPQQQAHGQPARETPVQAPHPGTHEPLNTPPQNRQEHPEGAAARNSAAPQRPQEHAAAPRAQDAHMTPHGEPAHPAEQGHREPSGGPAHSPPPQDGKADAHREKPHE